MNALKGGRPKGSMNADKLAVLRGQFADRPFFFLDLGCGDAATLAPLLSNMAIQRYKGVDLSETALALAAENLKSLPCPLDLVWGGYLGPVLSFARKGFRLR
jgi:methylase of polypeptide subunit release factors